MSSTKLLVKQEAAAAVKLLSYLVVVVVVQSPSCVRLFATPWTTVCQTSLSLTISWSLPKFMFIASVIPSCHLILWCPVLPLIFLSFRDFSHESSVHIGWPKSWSFSFSINPSNVYSELTSFKIDCLISLLFKGLWGVFCSTTVQKYQSSGALPSLWSSSHNHTWPLGRP